MVSLGVVLKSMENKIIDFGDFFDCVSDVVVCNIGIVIGFWVMVVSSSDIFYIVEILFDWGLLIFYDKDFFKLIFWFYLNDVLGMVEYRIVILVWYYVFVSWKKGELLFFVVNGVYDFWGFYLFVLRF